ncbi:MAG: ribonuclease R [Nitrospirae bacterium]|nr:ribonuclease R [Nitrospirota bacterium]
MADRIVSELLTSDEHLVSRDLLLRRLIPKKNKNMRAEAEAELEVLVRGGSVLRLPDGRLSHPSRLPSLSGRLDANRDGYGFVIDPEGKKDVFVPAHFLAGAIDGDTVVCHITGEDSRGRREGVVSHVVSHSRTDFPGLLIRTEGGLFVRPRDARIRHVFRVDDPVPPLPEGEGTLVVLTVTSYPDVSPVPSGRIVSVLGADGDPAIDTDLVIASFGLPLAFPSEVEEAAHERATSVRIAPEGDRKDMRTLEVVTIDGDSAKDFDDAISLVANQDGTWTLGVHIADVSSYVLPGSPLDREAFARATSVYFPDRVVPMFPEVLSNGVLSLNPDEDRLARSIFAKIGEDGSVVDWSVTPSVIRSRKRMTYSEVHRSLAGDPSEGYRSWGPFLEELWRVAQLLRKRRMAKGSLDFDLPEPEIVLDLRGEPVDILRSPRYMSHQLIEEFMLLANTLVASRLSERLGTAIFRAHESPSPERIENLYSFLDSLGVTVVRHDPVTPKDLSLILEKTRGTPVEHPVHYAVLRSLKQARYDERPLGHFGLSFSDYTHFTSPIRRYPDLVVHRLLSLSSPGGKEALIPASLSRVAQHCSEKERKATEAERMAIDFKKVRFMSRHLGESFDGRITGVASYGVFVELVPFFVEGLIPISQLGRDYYEYREDRHQIRGEKTGRTFSVGDALRVTVAKVDFQRLRCDFVLEEEAENLSDSRGSNKKRRHGHRGR